MLLVLLALHAALALAAPLVARRAGRSVFLACALAPAATVGWAAWQAPGILDGVPVRQTVAWVPSLQITASLHLDAFALLMVGLVSGIGVGIFLYAYGYFSKPVSDLGQFAASLTAFAGSMLGLVLADNLLLLFVFWELTSITSYLLIGFEDRKQDARDAALQALLTTGAGGLALLGGLVLVGQAAGTYEISELAQAAPVAGPAVHAGVVLILVGCFTKSAQVPFHTWLPGAMAAPTPVSAYLHSATMVKAGIYLVARLAPVLAIIGPWRPLVLAFGLATMLLGGYRALRQTDLKLLLAFGTVSQLGFLTVLFGLGTPETTFAGTALLLAHGLFKAALFMVVGVIDKKAGTRDLRELAGAHRTLRSTVVAGTVAAASMAGLPPLFGFIAKEAAYEALLHEQAALGPMGLIAIVGIVVGSILTFAYSARFVSGIWGRGAPDEDGQTASASLQSPDRPSAVFAWPAIILAGLTVVIGVLPLFADGLVNAGATALEPAWDGTSLALWHGLNLALALSGVTIAVGGGLYLARSGVARVQGRVRGVPDSTRAFFGALHGTLRWAKRITGVVQNGSLPVYLGVILIAVVVLPGSALVRAGLPAAPPESSILQTAVSLSVAVAAVATVTVRRRFAAVLFLGAVGFGVGLLFVVKGAPDLALTQFIVETLSLIIFVLVLRHLPDRFRSQAGNVDRAVRAAFACAVGAFVFVFALIAGAARTAAPVSEEYLARALPEAAGRNVVNVILVDFRSLDTLGEVIVLVIAAMGIASLVIAARLDRRDGTAPDSAPEPSRDGARGQEGP